MATILMDTGAELSAPTDAPAIYSSVAYTKTLLQVRYERGDSEAIVPGGGTGSGGTQIRLFNPGFNV
jgi:hypothetical protein